MRFPRNAKIFRGQLDAAPLAGVFFLLLIFLILASLIYTPGIPVEFSAGGPKKTVTVFRNGRVVFENQAFRTNGLDLLRESLKKLPPDTTLVISGPEAPRDLILKIRDLAKSLSLRVESSGIGIELPTAENTTGTDGPTALVSVDITGQFIFENQLITPAQLKERLTELAKTSREPLTLVILADKDVESGTIQSLTEIAGQAGIHKGLWGNRPIKSKKSP